MKVINYEKFIEYLDYLLSDETKPKTDVGKAYREGAIFVIKMIRRRAVVMADEMPESIVRCKNCKHSEEMVSGQKEKPIVRVCRCGIFVDCKVDDDFFCKNGERRESE